MKEKEIVLYSDDAAAKQVNVTIWQSRSGKLFTSEESARNDGCTHKSCACGGIARKWHTLCEACQDKLRSENYLKKPFQEWDGNSPVYCEVNDKWFYSDSDLEAFCEDEEIPYEELRLVMGKPNNYFPINEDHWSDIMPDDNDGELPEELQAALDRLNKVIATLKPASYSPGKIRTEYKGQ